MENGQKFNEFTNAVLALISSSNPRPTALKSPVLSCSLPQSVVSFASFLRPHRLASPLQKDAILQEGDSGLVVGEKWKLKDLLDFSLIISSNDGIYAVAEALNEYGSASGNDAISLMNKKAKDLGLNDTVFSNPTGLDINGQMSGSYSSAYDISKLLENIIKNNPDMVSKTNTTAVRITSLSNISHIAINTNEAINDVPGMIASKTGFTDLAGGNLAIAFDAGIMHPIVVVVLGSTQEGRFSDIESLANMTLQKISE